MSNEEREKFAAMDIQQKKEHLKNLVIFHPRFKAAINKIRHVHESKEISNDPQCMFVTGPSGAGKSTVLKNYVELYGKTLYGTTRTKKTILSTIIPSPARLGTFTESLLDNLGDPYPLSGTIGTKMKRLENLIKDCGVELIMLDEFQHFVKTDNPRTSKQVADNFKSLINQTEVSVVLFGLMDAEMVFKINEQLGRRFTMKEELFPFSYGDKESTNEFRKLLSYLDSKLPFVDLSGLGAPELADKIMSATGGLMNSIMKLIKEAALYALKQDKSNIELMDFAAAFELHSFYLSGSNNEVGNPFL